MGLWCPGCRNISMSNWIFWGYNGCVETWCTGMQQSGFDRASNQLSSPRGEQIAVWMTFNHLADRLHLDSSLKKGSVWDVDVPCCFSSASGLWSFWVGAMGEHFLSVLSPFFQCIIFHVSTVKSLFWWKACDLCVSSCDTTAEPQHQTLTLRGPDGLIV